MCKIIQIIAVFIISSSYLSAEFSLLSPVAGESFCSNEQIIFTFDKQAGDFNIRAFDINMPNDKVNLINLVYIGKTISWLPNDPALFDKQIGFEIFEISNPNQKKTVSNIIINTKSELIEQSTSFVACEGEDIILDFEVKGNINRYQWYKDDKRLDSAIYPRLIIRDAKDLHSGVYTCRAIGESECANLNSNAIVVYIAQPTSFFGRPDDIQWKYLDTVRVTLPLHVNFNDDISQIKFYWVKDTIVWRILNLRPFEAVPDTIEVLLEDGAKYSGTSTNSLSINGAVFSDRTNYRCHATGLCGTDTSGFALGESDVFEVNKLSPDFEACTGSNVEFEVEIFSSYDPSLFTYQWYKTGGNIINESSKFVGTKTPKLIIKGVEREDAQAYYCSATLVTKNITKRSEHFLCEPIYPPDITVQTKFWSINGRRNYYENQFRLYVVTSNYRQGNKFELYKDGRLINTITTRKGEAGCNAIDLISRGNESQEGIYWCHVSNDCGDAWSDTMYIGFGYPDVYSCLYETIELNSTYFGVDYTYEWYKGDTLLHEGAKYTNTMKSSMFVNNLSLKEEGEYNIITRNVNNGDKRYLGSIYLEIIGAPIIAKDLPDVLQPREGGGMMPLISMGVLCKGKGLSYELYIDGKVEEEGYRPKEGIDDGYGFALGGGKSNLKPGVYQYRFENECRYVAWSKKMTVINPNYKPTGGAMPNEDSTNEDNFTEQQTLNIRNKNYSQLRIYPNPAGDFINISIGSEVDLITREVQIIDLLGLVVSKSELTEGNNRIDISDLARGTYFIKVGDKVEKFVKM